MQFEFFQLVRGKRNTFRTTLVKKIDNIKSASFLHRSIATALVKRALLHAFMGPKMPGDPHFSLFAINKFIFM
jgi:hypothetical protein